MTFRYDYNLNNTLLSVYDAATNTVLVSRSRYIMQSFTAMLVVSDDDALVDSSIDRFMQVYRELLIRVKHP